VNLKEKLPDFLSVPSCPLWFKQLNFTKHKRQKGNKVKHWGAVDTGEKRV